MPNSLAVEIFTVAVLADAPLFSVTLTVTTLPLTDVLHHVSVDDAETALSFVVAVMVFPVLSAALLKFREDGATVSLLFLSRKRYCRLTFYRRLRPQFQWCRLMQNRMG